MSKSEQKGARVHKVIARILIENLNAHTRKYKKRPPHDKKAT
jgi:hypothetical protein